MQVLEGLQRLCVNLDTVIISKHVQAEVDRQAIFPKRWAGDGLFGFDGEVWECCSRSNRLEV